MTEQVEQAVNTLIEHFDGVVIIGSVQDETGTVFYSQAKGNGHACEGAVLEWLRKRESYQHGYHAETGRQDAAHGSD